MDHDRIEDRFRGTGRSTRQLRAAPKNAVYIIPGGGPAERYFRKLAEWQHRRDLTFLPADADDLVDRLRGLSRPVAIDHAALALPSRVWEEIGLINQVAMRGITAK